MLCGLHTLHQSPEQVIVSQINQAVTAKEFSQFRLADEGFTIEAYPRRISLRRFADAYAVCAYRVPA